MCFGAGALNACKYGLGLLLGVAITAVINDCNSCHGNPLGVRGTAGNNGKEKWRTERAPPTLRQIEHQHFAVFAAGEHHRLFLRQLGGVAAHQRATVDAHLAAHNVHISAAACGDR